MVVVVGGIVVVVVVVGGTVVGGVVVDTVVDSLGLQAETTTSRETIMFLSICEVYPCRNSSVMSRASSAIANL